MAELYFLRIESYEGKKPLTMDVFCKQPVKVGDLVTPPMPNAAYTPEFEVTGVLESKKPTEFGARPLSWDMAPASPSMQSGVELSYSGVDGRDGAVKGKHFLSADEHRQRMAFVKGDPKQDRQHGWHWARVNVKRV